MASHFSHFSAAKGLAAVSKHTVVSLVSSLEHARSSSVFDALILIASSTSVTSSSSSSDFAALQADIDAAKTIDAAVGASEVAVIPSPSSPGKRLILASTGSLARDYDDVRRFADAADKALKRAVKAGSRRPVLAVLPGVTKDFAADARYSKYVQVALLSALAASYVPIEAREASTEAAEYGLKVAEIGWLPLHASSTPESSSHVVKVVNALEAGRIIARDIGGSDPERMSALLAAEHIQGSFKDAGNPVQVKVVTDLDVLRTNYPLLAAVSRASEVVPRHRPAVVELQYTPEGEISKTVLLVGKGITYDTGGADLKVGGSMQGMHRDKCGAANVAGFFKTISLLRPKGVAFVGKLAFVRNSIGADAYVSDELIRSRSGARVRIGNTDAEGRMVMADLLCELKEVALAKPNPLLFTIATLTGHAVRAYGPGYSIVMNNGPANKANVHGLLSEAGQAWGDPFEISTVRREDFDFVAGKHPAEDVVQANNQPSVNTSRGHQYPAAFLAIASGLDRHGNDSERPLPYSHLDIAGSAGFPPVLPTGSPLVALTAAFVPGL